MRVMHVPAGVRFPSPFGDQAETRATRILLDDGKAGGWDRAAWSFPSCEDTGEPGNLHVVTYNQWPEVGAWLEGTGHAALSATLGEHAKASLAHMVLWHEIGHAILGMRDNRETWRKHLAETWCDALGTASMLAAGGSPDAVRAVGAIHGPASLPLDGGAFDEESFRIAYAHDTLGVCDAVLRRWQASPWADSLEALLQAATAATLEVAPGAARDRNRYAAMAAIGKAMAAAPVAGGLPEACVLASLAAAAMPSHAPRQ